MAINTWATRSSIWRERVLQKKKHVSLQLAFSMVVGLLHPSEWTNGPPTTPEYQDLARCTRADFRGTEFTSSSQSFWLSWEGLQTRSLQLAGLIAYVLRVSGFEDVPRSDLISFLRPPPSQPPSSLSRINTSANSSTATRTSKPPAPPSRLKVPLLENFCKDGVRPQRNSWQEWYASRVRDLVEHIEEEEWYGYYVYTLENTDNLNPIGSRDPAMENIHFKLGGGGGAAAATREPPSLTSSPSPSGLNNNRLSSPPSSARLPLEAQGGKDGVTGEFDFFGTVTTTTGHVSLRKTYKGAHYWDYDGVMTPVGIVGEWGREGTGYSGYFWLWKRSWMVGDAVQKTYAYS